MDVSLISLLEEPWFEFLFSIGLIFLYYAIKAVVRKIVLKHADRNDLAPGRSIYVIKFFSFFLNVLLWIAIFAVWNLQAKSLFVYFGTFFTVAGVALFAQWSILSNITASVILFFSFPFKIGSKIRIMDDKNSVTGIVEDITFFVIQIRTAEGGMVSYPNNLAIQKGIVAYPEKQEEITVKS
ncbi:MAG: mechanosensitive ion channel family protein [Spirosomaceae bacterium]|nr:mechanosensitive ion channel family protein [Spirosomataceae bacterium]